jgi:hypothetical protein
MEEVQPNFLVKPNFEIAVDQKRRIRPVTYFLRRFRSPILKSACTPNSGQKYQFFKQERKPS